MNKIAHAIMQDSTFTILLCLGGNKMDNPLLNFIFSPTENIVTFFSIPFIFIDVIVGILLFTTLLDINYTKKQFFCCTILMVLTTIINKFFIPSPISIIINMILFPICIHIVFKVTIFHSILCAIIPFSFTIILESFFEKLFYIFLQMPIDLLLSIPFYRFSIASLVYICMYVLYKFIKKSHLSITILTQMNKKNKNLIIINLILGLLVIFCQFYLLNYYSDNFPLITCLINILCLIAYFVISFVSFINISKLETTSMSLEESQLSYKTLELLYDNMRTFKHDFGNILDGFASYIAYNDMEGLKKYYDELSLDFNHINNLSTLNPKVINNHSIYVLLANKYHKADEKGIKIDLKVLFDLNTLQINMYEFSRMLGILLDNAIEATSECDEKLINVIFQKDSHNPIQYIIISNTYANKSINTEKIFEKNFSTKKGNTGLGLWEIKQLLKKNNRLNLKTTITKKYFTQKLEIYY